MKYLKDIKNKIKWQQYNNPAIDWGLYYTYNKKMVDESFVETFKDKINWRFFSASLTTAIVNNIDFLTKYQDKVDWEKVFSIKRDLVQKMRDGDIPPFCKGRCYARGQIRRNVPKCRSRAYCILCQLSAP